MAEVKGEAKEEAKEAKDDEEEEKITPIVEFESCLRQFSGDETIADWRSPATGQLGNATKRASISSFPRYLMVQLRRYYQAPDWTIKKLDVLVPMPDELNLESMRGHGIEEGEDPLPESEDAAGAGGAEGAIGAGGAPSPSRKTRICA